MPPPYAFVRALRQRRIAAPAIVRVDAVQLLTVHGAKGLEADTVFVIDAQPELPRSESSTLLVEWPAHAPHPTRVAFVASLARCAPSLRALRDSEAAAQAREDLNALYVAMTRAKRTLVFSSTVPHAPGATASGWPLVLAPQAWTAPAWSAPPARAAEDVTQGHVRVRCVPRLQRAPDAAVVEVLAEGTVAPPVSSAAKLGTVVHRAMEWLTDLPLSARAEALPRLLTAAVREASADAAQAKAANGIVRALLAAPGLAPWLDPAQCLWARNEHTLAFGGEVLRIDRLVQRDDGGGLAWWVLDYKLEARPETLPAYREQLLRYCEAVRSALGPGGAPVRAAFISGQAEFIPLSPHLQ